MLKVLIRRERFGDCRWLKASMKMYPISSRLSSDHTVETGTAFSFVMLTVVAVVAFLPHVPLLSSPEGFICLGTSCSWEILSNRAGNWCNVSVCSTDAQRGFNLLILLVCSGRGPRWWDKSY